MQTEKELKKEFEERVYRAVTDYIEGEEGYGDSALLQINPADLSVEVVEEEDSGIPEDVEVAYCPMMDLVKMSVDNPGAWIPDEEAIEGLASQFC